MALEDYVADMERCSQCTFCEWVPLDQIKSWRFAKGCPSVSFNNFLSYSARGRLAAARSILQGNGYSDRVLDIVYKCLTCGSCDVSCKICRYNMEPLETMRELRFRLVQDGQLLAQHIPLIDNLRKEDNMMMQPRTSRSKWTEGLDIKDLAKASAETVFHAGCRFSYDETQWNIPRTAVTLLKDAGIDIGILGKDESCCGGRAYDMGYKGEFTKFAENNIEIWKNAGVKTVVTSCADCYHAFKRLYPPLGSKIEVIHTVEYLDRLIKQGKIKFTKNIPLQVTYHDPCHLGRQGEPYVPWNGKEKKILGQLVIYEPRKPRYSGINGIYESPRDVLKAIPGIKLVEMERIKEYAWCCGSGGGVRESYPDFSAWTAKERIEEARCTGAEAIVSACGWCERNFKDAVDAMGEKMKVLDIAELVRQSI